ncbi:3-oxoacyl-[acyl-carrier-protein] reductase [Armatimonas sp.]|uniref:3-oxoacyl-[acyl-carrier-protein] reductase n=1 Tax=Armatimonas sp. TaxID=1872638 RepID=UPI00286B543C|nr:3-oxoacyl-[acyl-carrier-protein] reductase [Armatimonas sp.]
MSLEGKIAIVTGAGRGGRGIGRGIALALAQAGANIAITSRSNIADAEAVAEAVRETGRTALAIQCDVSDAASVESLFATVKEQLGRVDILVNNAGITRDTLLLRMSEDDWDGVLDANLKGTFLCTRAAAKIMLRQKSGRIINITSVNGQVGSPGQANYSASKAGMIGFTKSVARELASRNITVNAVAPGFIDTQMTDFVSGDSREKLLEKIPLGRLGTAEDVGAAVAFLASEAASYITGQTLTIDGGLTV